MSDVIFPHLGDWEPTRATLHAYALAVSAIPRAHAEPKQRFWHLGLTVTPEGLVTDDIRLPGGGSFRVRMDLQRHLVVFDGDATAAFDMMGGLTGTEFADQLVRAAGELGLGGDYLRLKFENPEPRQYDPGAAERFFGVLLEVSRLFEVHRAGVSGESGPVHLWPHGFDLSFEWFGTKTGIHDGVEYPSQLNLGFFPAGRPYFYSNPWPFDKKALVGTPLPSGAEWFTDGWEGTILYYDQLVGDPEGPQKLLEYARAVFEIALPTLVA